MAVYITGDTHGDLDRDKLSKEQFPKQRRMKNKDVVIIAGDFGAIWNGTSQDTYNIKWYNEKKFTTAFVDGNHENHWLLNSYPVRQWHGGKVHRISDKVVHLMRGEIYNIEGKTFFVMGGASSVDKAFRQLGVSWWPEELPDIKEYNNAMKNLIKHNFKVDYVITHTCPTKILDSLYSGIHPQVIRDEVSDFLNKLEDKDHLQYTHWYFGHHHVDKLIDKKHTAVYNEVIRII